MVFLSDDSKDISEIIKEIQITIDVHDSKDIFIVGHYDCAGNPVTEITHKKQVIKSVDRIKSLFNDLNVFGLWISYKFFLLK
jgi:carbonic anhydrase